MPDTNIHELEAIIRPYVQEQFPGGMIERVDVSEVCDSDGDCVVNITIVLVKNEPVSGFSEMTRRIWNDLSARDFGFPVLSFRSVEEDRQLAAA